MFLKRLGIEKGDKYRAIKVAIWLYYFLLIFEGALRKWVLPGLAGPLLVIRDPVALFIIFSAFNRRVIINDPILLVTCFIGIVSFITAMTIGHGNLFVALYGVRTLVVHLPVVFIMGKVFTRDDVIHLGKATLYLTIGMAFLIALQFYSPQSAWVNRGIGGDEAGAGFRGALGFFRPPGTFSFTNGNTLFFSFVAPFVIYFALNLNLSGKLLGVIASVALIAAIPLSISRALLFQVVATVMFGVFAASRKPGYLKKLIVAGILFVFIVALLSQTSFFSTSTGAFTSRFESANKTEGGLQSVFLDRFLGGLINSVTNTKNFPFFGSGIGIGTNVGSAILTGERKFLITEGEWGRIIGELGVLLGLTLILLRLSLSLKLLRESYFKMVKGDMLPWLLVSFGFITIAQGLWAQPTALGFSTMIGGLTLASLNSTIGTRKQPLNPVPGLKKAPLVPHKM